MFSFEFFFVFFSRLVGKLRSIALIFWCRNVFFRYETITKCYWNEIAYTFSLSGSLGTTGAFLVVVLSLVERDFTAKCNRLKASWFDALLVPVIFFEATFLNMARDFLKQLRYSYRFLTFFTFCFSAIVVTNAIQLLGLVLFWWRRPYYRIVMKFSQRLYSSNILVATYLFTPLCIELSGCHQGLTRNTFAPIMVPSVFLTTGQSSNIHWLVVRLDSGRF